MTKKTTLSELAIATVALAFNKGKKLTKEEIPGIIDKLLFSPSLSPMYMQLTRRIEELENAYERSMNKIEELENDAEDARYERMAEASRRESRL